MKKINQGYMIKDIRNIETIVTLGYGLDGMNEKRINMRNRCTGKARRIRIFNTLAAVFA